MGKYGLPYKGSKSAIADKILKVLPSGNRFVDLFGGGGAMSDCARKSNKYESVLYNELEPNLIDKQNQVYFQSAMNPDGFFMIFDHVDLSIGLGFTLYTFKDDFKTINIASDLIEIRANFSKDVLIDDLVDLAITIEEKRKKKEPLLQGLEDT